MKAEFNFLYAIGIVGYLVYNIVKAVKKANQDKTSIPKQREASPTVQPPVAKPVTGRDGGEDLKKMLEDLLGGGEKEIIPEKQVVLPKQQAYEKPQPAKSHIPVAKKAMPKAKAVAKPVARTPLKPSSATPVFTAHPEMVQRAFVESDVEEELEFDFDIRQAVLYSEILKRPQY